MRPTTLMSLILGFSSAKRSGGNSNRGSITDDRDRMKLIALTKLLDRIARDWRETAGGPVSRRFRGRDLSDQFHRVESIQWMRR